MGRTPVRKPRRPKFVDALVRDLLECSDAQELKSEIEEWRDNMDGANMTHLPKYEEVSEAADALDNIVDELEGNLSDIVAALEKNDALKAVLDQVVQVRNRPATSRSARAGEVQDNIGLAFEAIRKVLPEGHDLVSTLDDVEGQTEELAMVDFPGMY